MSALQRVLPGLWWAVMLAGGVVLAGLTLSLGSAAITLAFAMLLAAGALLMWTGKPKLLVIGLLFFAAPIDISKALVPPIDQFYSPGLYLTFGHVALLVLAVLWLVRRLIEERRLPPFGALDGWVLLFLTLIWAGAFRSEQGALAMASALSYSLAILAFYVASHAIREPGEWRVVLLATAAVVLVQLGYVLLQFIASSPLPLPGSKVLENAGRLNFGGAGQAFRPPGFLEHPNALADHMTLVMPPALALVLLRRSHLPRWVVWGAVLTLAAAGLQLLLSLSRGGWVSATLGMALVVAIYWRRRIVTTRQVLAGAAAMVVLLAAGIAAYPQILLRLTGPDDRATESRLILNNQALAIIRTAPMTGVGFGSYNRAAHETIAPDFARISPEYQQSLLQMVVHNHYLLLASELGIPAALFFLALLVAFLRLPFAVQQWRDPALYAIAIGLAGAVLAQMLFLNSDNYYADIRIFMLWLMLGCLRGICLSARASG